ncbi:hypothetical protein IJT10_05750, partial [bacterium]|nr:hypothetical protein [bacterium]
MIDLMRKYTSLLSVSYWLLAVILAFLRTGSLYFYNGEEYLATNALCIYVLICLVRFVSLTLIFAILIFLLRVGFKKFADKLFDDTLSINNKWLAYGILFFGWLPNLIIKYPGAMCWDTWCMLFSYLENADKPCIVAIDEF